MLRKAFDHKLNLIISDEIVVTGPDTEDRQKHNCDMSEDGDLRVTVKFDYINKVIYFLK